MKKDVYCPEYTDREILEMLAKIFGVGVNKGSYQETRERA